MSSIAITGATRGLGRALVRRFAVNGHSVAGCGRDAAAVARLGEEIEGAFAAVDVRDDEAVGRWAREVLDRSGPPDLLVNNAGLINANAPLWRVPPDEFAAVVGVNLSGVHHVLRHFLPAMIERGRGVVVNMSSGWGRSVDAEVAPYCATKWGVEGLTRALAAELPPGLAAIPVNPGIVDTEMLRSCFGDAAASYPGPDEWAETAAPWLLALGPAENGRPLTVGGDSW